MKIKVYTADGANSVEKDFALPEFEGNKGLAALRQVVIAHQANKRQGTVSTKTRTTVTGTGKKPFRQKGSGTARQGTRRGPQHYKGAVAHGPQPRDYSQKVNKKMKALAFARALFERGSEGRIMVIENLEVSAPKTKLIDKVLNTIEPKGKILLVDDRFADDTALAARNIKRVALSEAGAVSTLDVVRYPRILMSERGIETIIARVNGGQA